MTEITELTMLLTANRPMVADVLEDTKTVEDFAEEYARRTLQAAGLANGQGKIRYQNGVYGVEVCPFELMPGKNNRARQTVIHKARNHGGAGTIFFYPQNTVRQHDLQKIQNEVNAGFVGMSYRPKDIENRLRV